MNTPELIQCVKDNDILKLAIYMKSRKATDWIQDMNLMKWILMHGTSDMMAMVCDTGVEVNMSDGDNITPLHLACEFKRNDMIDVLTDRGANINSFCYKRQTPLHRACLKGSSLVIEALIKKGANVDILTGLSETPLHVVCNTHGHEDQLRSAQMLLDAGVDIQAKDQNGRTCLHASCSTNKYDCSSLFLRNGVNINEQDEKGNTALHLAALKDHTIQTKLLLEHGADPTIKNAYGKTHLDCNRMLHWLEDHSRSS